MRQKLVIASIVLLLASINCFAQGVVTPRRHRQPQQTNEQGTDKTQLTAKPNHNEATTEKALPFTLPVSSIKIKLNIVGQVAVVRVEHLFRNDTDENLEGTYYFPVPEGASLIEFAVFDGEERRVGRVKEKEEARAAFAAASAQGQDPAILEMTKRGWFQSHIYPIPPHADKRLEIIYSQVLSAKDGAIVFDYPLGQGYKKLRVPVGNVELELDLSAASRIKNVYSPTHPIDFHFDGERHVTGKVKTVGGGEAENFLLNYSLDEEDVSLSLLTYRKKDEDGYFLMMLSPKVDFDKRLISAKDVIFVVDVSGSMAGDKLKQAKEALRFGLKQTLKEADRFNIVAFDNNITPMSKALMQASQGNIASALEFVENLRVNGGTNINDSLLAAVQMFEDNARPHNLVFITDGQPNASVTNPNQIAANVRAANQHRARLFSFGIGAGVNHYLLEKLAAENRGVESNIADDAELSANVKSFFAKVAQPVLTDLQVDFGQLQAERIHPAQLPDLYTRGQIKIFGRYRNAEDLRQATIALTGSMNEQAQRFDFTGLDFPLETTDNEFLVKLWANERVAALLAEIRLYGEKAELKEEVIKLAREFNLVTPYTSMYVPTSNELQSEGANEQTPAQANAANSQRRPDASSDEIILNKQDATVFQVGGNRILNSQTIDSLPIVGRSMIQPASADPYANRRNSSAAPGTVVDSNGAVIPNATVTFKDQNTGTMRVMQTDASGNYSVAGLPPGQYSIAVAAPGFQTTQVQNVTVQPGQVSTTGVELSVGSASETVNVTSVASTLETDVSHNSSSYTPKKLKDLPMLEPVEKLSLLTPGVASTDGLNRPQTGLDREFNLPLFINGGRATSNTHTLNSANNQGINGQPVITVRNPDAVESLNVITTRSTGDLGLTGASTINLQTHSGGNFFHGSIFDYYLNRGLGALSPLERRSGLSNQPKYRNSLYGGTFNGPISRDRYFIFGSFQGESENAQRFYDSTTAYQTPTANGLQTLSSLFASSATVTDLLARNPLTQTLSPTQFKRTFKRNILGNAIEFGELTRLLQTRTKAYEANGRFDFSLTMRDTLQAEYWFNHRKATNAAGRLLAGFTDDASTNGQLGLLRWSRLLSPSSVNEAVFSFTRSGLSLLSDDAAANAYASVNIGLFGISYGNNPLLPTKQNSTSFDFSNTLSRSQGAHNFKIGGQVKRRLTSFNELQGLRGQYNFAGFEDFVLNKPLTFAVAAGDARTDFTETHQHYFADDSWRLQSNLTLSFGLSYERATQPINALAERILKRESAANTALFDVTLPLALRTLAKVKGDNNNFAPRFGFAYTPRFQFFKWDLFGYDKTVIRGGASVSYDQTLYRPLADLARSSPNILLAVIKPEAGKALPGFPQLPDQAALQTSLNNAATTLNRLGFTEDFRSPYSLNWHFSITRDFNSQALFEIGYAGSRGLGLTQLLDAGMFNNTSANANFKTLSRTYASTGRSTYHALQTKLDFQVIDTLTAGFSYTLSKLLDDVPDYSAAFTGINQAASFAALQSFAQNPLDVAKGERALSNLDRRHSFAGHFLWTLPRLRGRAGFLAKLTEGWQAGGILEFASGSPYTALQYYGQSENSTALYSAMFADRYGNLRPFTGNVKAPTTNVAFSNAANQYYRFFVKADGTPFVSSTGFIIANRSGYRAGQLSEARFIYNDFGVEQAAQALGLTADAFGKTFAAGRAYGDEGRNSLLSPSLANIDFALMKTTKLSEKVSLQFRAEAFNLFNHPNRAKPNFIIDNAGGRGFADLGEVDASPRRIRLALKLIF